MVSQNEELHQKPPGSFMKSKRENSFVLVTVCALTNFIKLYADNDARTRVNLKKIEMLIREELKYDCFRKDGLGNLLAHIPWKPDKQIQQEARDEIFKIQTKCDKKM